MSVDDDVVPDDLGAWPEDDDASSRPFRALRLRLLADAYGTGRTHRLLPGVEARALAFEEARRTYLDGSFLACVLVAQTCVEHMLAGLFRLAGRDDLDRATYQRLLAEARRECFLSDDEFALFDRLRTLRNP